MHPTKRVLRLFAEDRLDRRERESVGDHLAECEFCREYLENEQVFLRLTDESADLDPDQLLTEHAESLFAEALSGRTIVLSPLDSETESPLRLLAADGSREAVPRVECLGTFYSETPELVLTVMHDNAGLKNYVQLVSDEASLVSNVLLCLPAQGYEVLTDKRGRADLPDFDVQDYSSLDWEVKMPDAVFSLEPLLYDPDKTTASEEFLFTTRSDTTIRVTFDEKTEGKQISIEVLALDGESDFNSLRMYVMQGDEYEPISIEAGRPVPYSLNDNRTKVDIRIFQQ